MIVTAEGVARRGRMAVRRGLSVEHSMRLHRAASLVTAWLQSPDHGVGYWLNRVTFVSLCMFAVRIRSDTLQRSPDES